MKAFRVRDIGQVEPFISWVRMDGTAYVLTGGLSHPYITVSPELAPAHLKEGRIERAGFAVDDKVKLRLVEEEEDDRENALIIIPSGGFDFNLPQDNRILQPSNPNLATVIRLSPGESLRCFPRVRTLSESETARPLALHFDGNAVTFTQHA